MKPCKWCGALPPIQPEIKFEEPTGYQTITHFCGMRGQGVACYGQTNAMREWDKMQEGLSDE